MKDRRMKHPKNNLYGSVSIKEINNNSIVVGRCYTWQITYTVGEVEISPAGKLVFVIPMAGFSSPKIYPPSSKYRERTDTSLTGYIVTKTTNKQVKLQLSTDAPPVVKELYGPKVAKGNGFQWSGWTVTVSISGNRLRRGEKIELLYGDTSSGSPGAVSGTFAHRAEFKTFIDPNGRLSGPAAGYFPVEGEMIVEIQNETSDKLVVTMPTIQSQGNIKRLKVVSRDRYENVVKNYSATLKFMGEDRLLAQENVSEKEKGIHILKEKVGFKQKGIHYIEVIDSSDRKGRSNPILIKDNFKKHKIFWGDLHVHIRNCDGLGTMSEAFEYGRDAADCDFVGLSPHDILTTDRDWAELKTMVQRYYEPGKFVTFLGYEYSDRTYGGDQTVVFATDDAQILRLVDKASNRPDKLWQLLPRGKAMCIPHSPAHYYMGTNWKWYNPDFQRLVEIYSEWGNSEYRGCPWPVTQNHRYEIISPPDGHTVQEGFAQGCRLGIMASSDNHSGQPGYCDLMGSYSRRRAYRGGITGVYAKELTREALWDALFNRMCYGTTGVRILLHTQTNGHEMGTHIKNFCKDSKALIKVVSAGTDIISRIDVVRNNKNVYSIEPNKLESSFSWQDSEPLDSIYNGENKESGGVYYYVRLTQRDGHMAWSSPVWFAFAD